MIFAVTWMRSQSDLMLVETNIDVDRYSQNLDRLGFTDALDEKHSTFGWIFQQNGNTGSYITNNA
jgi:hypothetical protein